MQPTTTPEAKMDTTTMTPAELDAAWLAAVAPAHKLYAEANALDLTAAKYHKAGGNYTAQGDRYAQRAHDARMQARELETAAAAPYQAEWNARGGWTRAYVVPAGHIHRSTSCHTLHPTTLIAWLPELSGHSEDEIVAAAGTHACTVCYPTAPVAELLAAEAAAKAANECPGSRGYDHRNWRQTSYTGTGRAVCNHCGQHIGTSKTGKLRAHAPAAVAA